MACTRTTKAHLIQTVKYSQGFTRISDNRAGGWSNENVALKVYPSLSVALLFTARLTRPDRMAEKRRPAPLTCRAESQEEPSVMVAVIIYGHPNNLSI